MGLVDLVITPVGGFGWIVAEDAIDHFVIRRIEKKWKRRGLIRFMRVALNPARSFANVMRLKLPWHRSGRELNRLAPDNSTDEEPQIFLADPEADQDDSTSPDLAILLVFVPV